MQDRTTRRAPRPLLSFQKFLKTLRPIAATAYHPTVMAERTTEAGPAGTPSERIAMVQERFIALWGEMGSAWGIPRTMAEAHALLYIVGDPMNTDEVMERLHISRGNASMTLRTLVEWGLVARVHNRGDRKEYFRAEQDVWRLFATIVRERKRREFDPLLAALEQCRLLAEPTAAARRRIGPEAAALDAHQRRLDRMLETTRTLDQLSERFIASGGPGMQLATKLLGRKKVS